MVNKMPEETPAEVRAQKAASPVQPGERIAFVDILRGFAIFGILVANMAGFSGYAPFLQDGQAVIDGVVLVLIRLFITAKFYSLFSFLFGWGLSVQMARARERGTKFTPLYLRRLLVLLLIGIVHGVLIWSGDILTDLERRHPDTLRPAWLLAIPGTQPLRAHDPDPGGFMFVAVDLFKRSMENPH